MANPDALLDHGASHAMVRRAIGQLREYGDWPLSEAALAVTDTGRIVLKADDGTYALPPRGWQRILSPRPLRDVRLRLKRGG